MNGKTIQDLLAFVEQPSRYLGTEINTIHKDPKDIRLFFALAFPDLYEIGTSHFGLQILYSILNGRKEIAAERVFAPALDMEARLRENGVPLSSLESGKPLVRFDIIGFSLLYELNYTNILTMLDLSGLPFLASERDGTMPMVVAGGPCACNPEPVAAFFDAIVVGDGEQAILEMADAWLSWKETKNGTRANLLDLWSKIEGVYVPSLFESPRNFASPPVPRFPDYSRVKRAIAPDLNDAPFPIAPIVPYGRPVHDRLRLEIARGCTRGCRFCQAGVIYRPVRERSPEILLAQAKKSLAATGYEDISLLSLSTGDYGCISGLMQQLSASYESRRVAISFPSFRAGTLTPELMSLIKRIRKTGFTIAPEAGSQRLRDVINKNITDQEIIDTVDNAFKLGWQVIKLYFMIGLPTETDADIASIIRMVKELSKIKPKGRKGKINVSIGVFVPKPWTPFQWAPQIAVDDAWDRIHELKDRLRSPMLQVKWQRPEVSLIEGLFSRGDRRMSNLLIAAWKSGCRFDGWTDSFRYDLWKDAIQKEGVDVHEVLFREKDPYAPAPWDHIDMRISRDFLVSEREKALTGTLTEDCRNGNCEGCSCCDFETIKPVCFSEFSFAGGSEPPAPETSKYGKQDERTLMLTFSKMGRAKYFGHLEMVNIFIRAIRRAGIPVAYSEGFHPAPKIAFQDPLPVGMESRTEFCFLTVTHDISIAQAVHHVNLQLPEGIVLLDGKPAPPKSRRKPTTTVEYDIRLNDPLFQPDSLRVFQESEQFQYVKTNAKGKVRTIDLKKAVVSIGIETPNVLKLTLTSEQGGMIRPAEAIREIFGLSDESLKQARIVKAPAYSRYTANS